MYFANFLLIIVVVILVTIIINQLTEYYCDTHEYDHSNIKFIPNKYHGIVKKVALAYSHLKLFQFKICNPVWSHYDLIIETDNNKRYMIRYTYDRKPKEGQIFVFDSGFIIDVVPIKHAKEFNLDGYVYTISHFEPTVVDLDIEDVFTLVKESWLIHYNALRHNCHHKILDVTDVLTGKKIGNEFEEWCKYTSPMKYGIEFLNHTFWKSLWN
jgi:hypothetical protein